MKATKKLIFSAVLFTLLVATATAIVHSEGDTTAVTASKVLDPTAPENDVALGFRLTDTEALKLTISSADKYIKPPVGQIEKIPGAALVVHPSAEKPLILGSGAPGAITIEKGTKLLSNFTIRVPFELTINNCDVSFPDAGDGIYLYNCRGGEAILQIKKKPPHTKELELVKPDVIVDGSRAVFPGFEVVEIASMRTINLPAPRLVRITVSVANNTMIWDWYVVDKYNDTHYLRDGDRVILAAYKNDSTYAYFPEANTTVTIEVWGETDHKPHKVEDFTVSRPFYLAFPRDVPVFAERDGYTATFYLQPHHTAIYQLAVVEVD
ncbi:hypothetical protein [Thermococcus sp. MAR1]|uniref:hypothetical protein n=1 Tax=Thermococcus sp. MAR1 TaxID=1638263 RepID=UPI001439C746|nr:hypothetical protein [Thermococcus sp. MAR1]NJE09329.1 hypothetical protein [Thermococcus sp. MAR1]